MKSFLKFEKQFTNKEEYQQVLNISYQYVSKHGFLCAFMIMIFELCMIGRTVFIGLGSRTRNLQYLSLYTILFLVSTALVVFIPIWSKDLKKFGTHIYWMEIIFTIVINGWAIAITLLDGIYHAYFDMVVYMTISLIAPVISYLNPIFLVMVQLVGGGIILGTVISLGYIGSAINFGVFATISLLVCIVLQHAKKEMYLNQYKLTEKAIRDPLTGIFNRQTLLEDGIRVWEDGLHTNHSIAVIMADVDHFKQINDEHGHLKGDECLKMIAKVFQTECEKTGNTCYRYGGEEFLILLPSADVKKAVAVTEEIMASMKAVVNEENIDFPITASFGIYANVPSAKESFEGYLSKADKLLYQSKENGRNCYTTESKNV